MIRSKNQKINNQITGINITPFTDICLVLLIIFMVTANTLMRDNSVPINLPKATSSAKSMPKSVTVKIARDQRIFVNNVPVTAAALEPTLLHHFNENTRILVVRADENVPYQSVIFAIDTARKVGIVEIALATRQPNSAPATDQP